MISQLSLKFVLDTAIFLSCIFTGIASIYTKLVKLCTGVSAIKKCYSTAMTTLNKKKAMSAFGNYRKDDIVSSIKLFIDEKKTGKNDIQINELIKETMEAVNYALEQAIWEIENGH
jgi:hypothetical protein